LSHDKACGKLALGQNCTTIISDKSNSVATFLRIQTDIYIYIGRVKEQQRTSRMSKDFY